MSLPNPNEQLNLPLEALSIKLKNGFSPMIAVVGDETGIGKTRYTSRCAELIYWRTYKQVWHPKGNMFFQLSSFKDELFNATGRVFQLEETEIELGSDEWNTIQNKWFSRIKDTQRIKGNLYFIVAPMMMAIAKKHRRRINWIIDVKHRGFANWYKIKKYSANLLGDDLSKMYIGSVVLSKPDCELEIDILDRDNKKRIETEQSEQYDKEIEYNKKVREAKIIKINKVLGIDQEENKEKIFKYEYKCHECKFIIKSNELINKVIKCRNCNNKVYIDEQNRVK